MWLTSSLRHELVWFHVYAFEASNKHHELIGNISSVNGVFTFTERIISSLPTNVSVTRPGGQLFCGIYLDFIITKSPILKFLDCRVHFERGVNMGIYFLEHLFQYILGMLCTCFYFWQYSIWSVCIPSPILTSRYF